MPAAFCEICKEVVAYKGQLKHAKCNCGNTNLVSVSSKWNEDFSGLNYYDRKGNFKKFVESNIAATVTT